MRVGTARAVAVEWVSRYARKTPGFKGAYFTGSTVWMPDDADMPDASDIDVFVVISQPEPPPKLGKFRYGGVLIEVSYISWDQICSAEKVLTSYHLAGGFAMDTIIDDPTGHLRDLQKEVSLCFAQYTWVRRRCEDVRQKIETGLRSIDPSVPWHDQAMGWLFSTGVTTHMVLVAALRNPTVRLRYLAARDVLLTYGYPDLYEDLLDLLGCARLSPDAVARHLSQLADLFDAAAAAARTPFPFSTDITAGARAIAIDGSYELIRTGYHREAVFWIMATFTRCHRILYTDAPDLRPRFVPAFDEAMADLGIRSHDDLVARSERVLGFLPKLWETIEEILRKNPGITAG